MSEILRSKVTAIIQARMSSTRLPGKVLLPINKKPMLWHVINQTKHSKFVDEIIVATTNNKEDTKIVDFCKRQGIQYFRGSNDDVLDRYYKCAKKFKCEIIVRITSDCPFIDPDVIDDGIEKFLKKSLDYIGNNIEYKGKEWQNATCNFPQGMTVEVCTLDTLRKTWTEAKKLSEREHVFPYVQFNSKIFRIDNFKKNINMSHIRCTVDRKEDLKFVREIYKRLKNPSVVKIYHIIKIIKKHKRLLDINTKIPFDEGYRISLQKDIQNIIKLNKIENMPQKIKLVLRVDGGHKIGMGHVYRMKNLAEYFPKNIETYFLTTNKNLIYKITKSKKILSITKREQLVKKLNQLNPDIIIVDRLRESTRNLEIFKNNAKFVIGIDYTAKNKNVLDLGIAMLYHNSALSSINLKNPFDLAIMKKSFLKNPKIRIRKKVNSVIILQGGSDTHCFIPKILDATSMIDDGVKITIVVGTGFKCWKKLHESVNNNKNKIKILHNISNMHRVMSEHDLAITAGGMTLLELAYLGIPSIIVCGEKFEVETAKKISMRGFGMNLGYGRDVSSKQIAEKIELLARDYTTRKRMNVWGRQIINGKGAVKISQIIQSLGANL